MERCVIRIGFLCSTPCGFVKISEFQKSTQILQQKDINKKLEWYLHLSKCYLFLRLLLSKISAVFSSDPDLGAELQINLLKWAKLTSFGDVEVFWVANFENFIRFLT